jgi:WD repeat-containing protein 68
VRAPCRFTQIVQLDDDKGEFVGVRAFDHPYPTTKILWAPEALAKEKDLLATTGDYLRLWSVHADGDVRQECVLNTASAGVQSDCGFPIVLRSGLPARL